ncbi:hypothetical protein PENPOL_c009G04865 [Penicillium polonicum]|uniref:Hydrophobin n=1 Tax=Penicillium polonicum TaxID=60169 RepID=A0A1V6NGB5_PENPO|nr:hypothetical protein PENPOL_c009G04865 [Penicillium polonicum]
MHLTIPSALAWLFLQTQALPTNSTLENLMIPAFVPVPSDANYKLCTQGCWPAALLCSSPAVSPPNASACGPVKFTSPLLEWYTRREFGTISLGCTTPATQRGCWTCCFDITPVF